MDFGFFNRLFGRNKPNSKQLERDAQKSRLKKINKAIMPKGLSDYYDQVENFDQYFNK